MGCTIELGKRTTFDDFEQCLEMRRHEVKFNRRAHLVASGPMIDLAVLQDELNPSVLTLEFSRACNTEEGMTFDQMSIRSQEDILTVAHMFLDAWEAFVRIKANVAKLE